MLASRLHSTDDRTNGALVPRLLLRSLAISMTVGQNLVLQCFCEDCLHAYSTRWLPQQMLGQCRQGRLQACAVAIETAALRHLDVAATL